MASFSAVAFDIDAFDVDAWDIDTSPPGVWTPPITATLTATPVMAGTLAVAAVMTGRLSITNPVTATLVMSTTNFYIGRDYVHDVTNVTFLVDGVVTPGDSSVVVTWELLDRWGNSLGSGTGSYVSSGHYTFTIDYLVFDSQRPKNPPGYVPGTLLVHLSKDGADGSVGSEVHFMYPPLTS